MFWFHRAFQFIFRLPGPFQLMYGFLEHLSWYLDPRGLFEFMQGILLCRWIGGMMFWSAPIDTRIAFRLSVDMLIPWNFPVDTRNGAPKVVERYIVRHLHSRKMCVQHPPPQKFRDVHFNGCYHVNICIPAEGLEQCSCCKYVKQRWMNTWSTIKVIGQAQRWSFVFLSLFNFANQIQIV